MRNSIIILSILLAAAIISGLILYNQYSDTKAAFIASEKDLADLNEKTGQLTSEISSLQNEIAENIRLLKELKKAKTRVLELEVILEKLKSSFEKNEKISEDFRANISTKENLISEMKTKLEKAESQITTLNKKISERQDKIKRLKGHLSSLEKQEGKARAKIVQLKEEHEAAKVELKREIWDRDRIISELKKKLQGAVSQVNTLNEEISEREDKIELLKGHLSSLEKQEGETKAQIAQLKGEHEAAKKMLKGEILDRDRIIFELEENLEEAGSQVNILNEQKIRCESKIEQFQHLLAELKGQRVRLKSEIGQLKSTYDNVVTKLKKQIQSAEMTIDELEGKLTISFLDHVLFEFGKAVITPEGREILSKLGQALKEVHGRQIRVIGHTDNVPIMESYRKIFPSNWELSAARAAAVVRHLQEKTGLDPADFEVAGRSFYDPVAGNETVEGRAQNRRVIITIGPKP